MSSTRAAPANSPEATFAVVCAVGPGEREVERVRDLFDSLEAFEPGNYHFVLIDDDQGPSRFSGVVPASLRARYIEIKNPRRGRGSGWAAGCAVAVLAGLCELRRRAVPFRFALKLDTDALVIAPFSRAVAQRLASQPGLGMVGSVRDANLLEPKAERVKHLGRAMDKLLKQFTLWRGTALGKRWVVQVALWGRYRFMRDILREGFINGYRVGEHCYGGGYALSGACVEGLAGRGLLARPCVWLPTPLMEDMIMTFCVKAIDFQIGDFSGSGEPFAVRYRGLPDTISNLVARSHSIIHSVKDFEDQSLVEAEIRSFFRERRKQALVA